MKETNYQSILKAEFESRRARNASYSLRAFSRQLAISPAQLSQLISGRRPLTRKTATKIAERLSYSPRERTQLLESTIPELRQELLETPEEIREEEFRVIADWYHFAILSLAEVRRHKADPRWIASRLGISVPEAAGALRRLRTLRFIDIAEGKIKPLSKTVRTSSDIPSSAIRQYHQQTLDKAKQKLEEVSVHDREFSTITTAISRKNIPKAKEMITKFKREVSALLENGEKTAVYTLAVQLFPVSKLEES